MIITKIILTIYCKTASYWGQFFYLEKVIYVKKTSISSHMLTSIRT